MTSPIDAHEIMASLKQDYVTLRMVCANDPVANAVQEEFFILAGDNARERMLVEMVWRLFRARQVQAELIKNLAMQFGRVELKSNGAGGYIS